MGLDKYSPEQWDWLLTVMADCKIMEQNCDECIYDDECPVTDMQHVCPVCTCFKDCGECMPGHGDRYGFGYCLGHGDDQMVDKLIERLEVEGIFET